MMVVNNPVELVKVQAAIKVLEQLRSDYYREPSARLRGAIETVRQELLSGATKWSAAQLKVRREELAKNKRAAAKYARRVAAREAARTSVKKR